MSKILVLAESGFGKTTSLVKNDKYDIEGLDPRESYIISVTSKELPGKGSSTLFPVMEKSRFTVHTQAIDLKDYRRLILNYPEYVALAIRLLGQVTTIRNIVLDDTNYLMQDYYMRKALSSGWDTPKRIGYDMGLVFEAIESLPTSKNFIMLAHGEEYDKADGRKGYRMKTTGKMVQEYITPEGKFDVVLIGTSQYDDTTKKAKKVFVTNDDGVFSSAKSHGIFDSLYIHNDMGFVVKKVNEYYG